MNTFGHKFTFTAAQLAAATEDTIPVFNCADYDEVVLTYADTLNLTTVFTLLGANTIEKPAFLAGAELDNEFDYVVSLPVNSLDPAEAIAGTSHQTVSGVKMVRINTKGLYWLAIADFAGGASSGVVRFTFSGSAN